MSRTLKRIHIGNFAIGFQKYHYWKNTDHDINLWRLTWNIGGFDNHYPTTELTLEAREARAKRKASRIGSANPDMPTRSRYDNHLNLGYRLLALLHRRNPFSPDYFRYTRNPKIFGSYYG